jgi:hypothetical protein
MHASPSVLQASTGKRGVASAIAAPSTSAAKGSWWARPSTMNRGLMYATQSAAYVSPAMPADHAADCQVRRRSAMSAPSASTATVAALPHGW